jgi:hypothetical protein
MSKKRILPAVLLAGTVGFLGLHRFYAGRYYTALMQLVPFVMGAAMLWKDLAGLEKIQTLEDMMEWAQNYPIRPVPWLLVGVPCFWVIGDCYALLAKKFKDGEGEKITRWV